MSESATGAWSELAGRRFRMPTATLCLATAIFAFNTFLVSTAMPTAVVELGGTAYLSWTLTVYIVAAIVAGSGAAGVAARFGTRTSLLAASLVFAVGTVVAAGAGSIAMVLVGRTLQGVGEGLTIALSYALIPHLFPSPLVPRIFGVEAVVWALGAFGGPVLSGYVTETVSWRAAFLANLPVVALFALLAAMTVPGGRTTAGEAPPPMPWPRLAMVAGAMMAVSVAAVAIESTALAAAVTLAAALILAAAVRIDRRSAAPILPAGAFSLGRSVGAGLWAVVLMPLSQSATGVFFVYAAQHVWDLDPTVAGAAGATIAVAWSGSSLVVSSMRDDRRRARAILAGSIALAAGLATSALALALASLTLAIGGLAVIGLGLGASWGNLCQIVMSHVDTGDRDKASALLPTLQSAGYAMGAALFGLVGNLSGFATAAGPDQVAAAIIPVYAVALVLALATVAVALRLHRLLERNGADTESAP